VRAKLAAGERSGAIGSLPARGATEPYTGAGLEPAEGGCSNPACGPVAGAWARGATWPVAPAGTGYAASSDSLAVGATRCSTGPKRAPQPPQKRESGAFSVPQLGQRIPRCAA
jgi:hypothetical protein